MRDSLKVSLKATEWIIILVVHWFTRNISDINPEFPISSIWRLADTYGEIYQLDFITHKSVIISSYDLINEICDMLVA